MYTDNHWNTGMRTKGWLHKSTNNINHKKCDLNVLLNVLWIMKDSSILKSGGEKELRKINYIITRSTRRVTGIVAFYLRNGMWSYKRRHKLWYCRGHSENFSIELQENNSTSKSTFEVLLHLMENSPFWDDKILIKMSVPAHTPKCVRNTISRSNFHFSKLCVGSHNKCVFPYSLPAFISMDHHWSVSTKISYSGGQDLPSPPLHCQKSMLSPVTLREETYGKKWKLRYFGPSHQQ